MINVEANFEVSVQEKLNEDGYFESTEQEIPWEGITPEPLNKWFKHENNLQVLKEILITKNGLDMGSAMEEYDFIEFSDLSDESGSFKDDGQFVADWRLFVRINCIPLNGSEIIKLLKGE